jgi:integrase
VPLKANLGKDRDVAVRLVKSLNQRYRIQTEQEAAIVEASLNLGGARFEIELNLFVSKYIEDYQLKASTARLLRQRQRRLTEQLGDVQVPAITTPLLRDVVSLSSAFEQSKLRTLLLRFFRYAKSTGVYPSHLPNPVDDLFVDPSPQKQRQRISMAQFRAIYRVAPVWMQWMMSLALHLALRRVDLVNLRFDDVVADRIVSPIRKTDSPARDMEATSVDFPIHPDVRRVITEARRSSLRVGRCPFIIHRQPDRVTARASDALAEGHLEHRAQVLPDYASKCFNRARALAAAQTNLFDGFAARELPTLHEIRALSSHLYASAGYDVATVQDLMAHTDPDMTRANQKGHARKVLRVEMMLAWSLTDSEGNAVEEPRANYRIQRPRLREYSLTIP